MTLGAMQPYFFPYLGYFDLINSVDRWIVADTMQYMRHGWVNRNRVLHQASGWQYILVPVRKHPLQTAIRDVVICEATDWRLRIRKQIDHYRTRAPFFRDVMELVDACLACREVSLSRLNVWALARVCEYLAIPFEPTFLAEMNLRLDPVEDPGDWAIRISQAVGARAYVNPPGGAALYDPARFAEVGIRLTIKPLVDFRYDCRPYDFIPSLSMVDVLMWNAPSRVKAYLDERRAATTHAADQGTP